MTATEGDKNDVECISKAGKEMYACFGWDISLNFNFKIIFSDRSGHHPFVLSEETACFIPLTYATRKREIYRENFNKVNDDGGFFVCILIYEF
jgi:hypothetical protein